MKHGDAGIRGVGEDTIRLVDLDNSNAAGRDRHLLPCPFKALAIIDIAVGAGAGEASLGGNLDGEVAVEWSEHGMIATVTDQIGGSSLAGIDPPVHQ